MIELRRIENQTCPVIVCDQCQQVIAKAAQGIVIWKDSLEWQIVHRVTCDERWRRIPGTETEYAYFDHLDDFLSNLVWNAGVEKPVWPCPERIAKRRRAETGARMAGGRS